jgi:hypothetical protein
MARRVGVNTEPFVPQGKPFIPQGKQECMCYLWQLLRC